MQYRKWKGLSIFEKIFLVSSLVFLLSFLALTTDRLVVVDKSSQDFTFVLLLLLNAGKEFITLTPLTTLASMKALTFNICLRHMTHIHVVIVILTV